MPKDYSSWTVPALKDELRRRKAAATGNKDDLVERLEAIDDRNCKNRKTLRKRRGQLHQLQDIMERVQRSLYFDAEAKHQILAPMRNLRDSWNEDKEVAKQCPLLRSLVHELLHVRTRTYFRTRAHAHTRRRRSGTSANKVKKLLELKRIAIDARWNACLCC